MTRIVLALTLLLAACAAAPHQVPARNASECWVSNQIPIDPKLIQVKEPYALATLPGGRKLLFMRVGTDACLIYDSQPI